MQDAVKLTNVSVSFQGQAILDDVSWAAPYGKSTVITGPSGSGKTTLLKVAAGILVPDQGTIEILGEEIDNASPARLRTVRQRTGYVFQDSALWANKTVLENVLFPLTVHRRDLSRSEIIDRARQDIRRFGLDRVSDHRPIDLSAGMQKAIAVARALVLEPELVFFDEPLISVDGTLAGQILEIVSELKQRGVSIITVTHSPDMIAMVADHLVILKDGNLLESGEFDDVKRSTNPEVRTILRRVLGEIISYDDDILELLGQGDVDN